MQQISDFGRATIILAVGPDQTYNVQNWAKQRSTLIKIRSFQLYQVLFQRFEILINLFRFFQSWQNWNLINTQNIGFQAYSKWHKECALLADVHSLPSQICTTYVIFLFDPCKTRIWPNIYFEWWGTSVLSLKALYTSTEIPNLALVIYVYKRKSAQLKKRLRGRPRQR